MNMSTSSTFLESTTGDNITITTTSASLRSSSSSSSSFGNSSLKQQQQQHERHCLVCYDVLEKSTTKTPCDHNEICGVCHLRLRYLHQDSKCPICKSNNTHVIVDKDDSRNFDEYPLWGNSLGGDYVYRDDVGMFFERTYYEQQIQSLFGYHCGVKGCDYDGVTPEFNIYASTATTTNNNEDNDNRNNKSDRVVKPTSTTPIKALQDHLRIKHRLALCNLCVDHQRDFVARLPRFTPSQLKQHLTTGGNIPGEDGHPICEFCKPKRFYDLTQLYQHLGKEHYKCHVCQQQLGLDNQYFKDYRQLERHFDRQHFLCHDVQCLTSRFVVFGSELDLRHHERTVHGGTSSGDTKIQLEFKVRRSNAIESSNTAPDESDFNFGLDGQAFVPAALPVMDPNQQQHQPLLSLHPLHVQRTASLRRQAAALRQAQQETVAFPTLGQAAAAVHGSNTGGDNDGTESKPQSQPFRVGWSEGTTVQRLGRRNAGEVTDRDFPSLPGTSTTTSQQAKVLRTRMAHLTTSSTTNSRNTNTTLQSRQVAAIVASGRTTNAPVSWTKGMAGSSPAAVRSAVGPTPAGWSSDHQNDNVKRQPLNAESNLAAENFPSLGSPSTTRPRLPSTAAVRSVAANKVTKNPPKSSSGSYLSVVKPSAGSSARNTDVKRSSKNVAGSGNVNLHPIVSQKPPDISNATDFPAPPVAGSRNTVVRRDTEPNAAKSTVEYIKTVLGSSKYKELKRYTREFATGAIDPETFVNHAAALFDQGFTDQNFRTFLPTLLSSCPDERAAKQAARYLESLQFQKVR